MSLETVERPLTKILAGKVPGHLMSVEEAARIIQTGRGVSLVDRRHHSVFYG